MSNNYFLIPNNKIVSYLIKIFSNFNTLPRLLERENSSRKDRTLWELEYEGKHSLLRISKPDYSDIRISITSLWNASSSEKLLNSAKKILLFLLVKINQQCQHKGIRQRDEITFPLQELVDCGLYASVKSARKGVLATKKVLSSIQIMGSDKVGGEHGKKEVVISAPLCPFTDFSISSNLCSVTVNPTMDIGFFCQAYAIVPKEVFALTNRGFTLLWYLCFLARQNLEEAKKKGCFFVRTRTIQTLLSLPEEEGNRDAKRTIKQPVEDAIREIMEATNGTVKIEIVNQGSSIKEYLKTGKLKISSSFIEYYQQLFEK